MLLPWASDSVSGPAHVFRDRGTERVRAGDRAAAAAADSRDPTEAVGVAAGGRTGHSAVGAGVALEEDARELAVVLDPLERGLEPRKLGRHAHESTALIAVRPARSLDLHLMQHDLTSEGRAVGGPRRFLSTGAAARVLGCHPTTVVRMVERGELSAHRLGGHGHYRLPAEEVVGLLHRTQPEPEDVTCQ